VLLHLRSGLYFIPSMREFGWLRIARLIRPVKAITAVPGAVLCSVAAACCAL
jgi:hypothetical protein